LVQGGYKSAADKTGSTRDKNASVQRAHSEIIGQRPAGESLKFAGRRPMQRE
jgi:hypothetical protein